MQILLDDVDIAILSHLQQNARLNHKELGEKVHKAPTTVYSRISRMEKAGLIRGYVALLNQNEIHLGQNVYTHVQIRDHSEESLTQFEEAIRLLPEVMECYHLTGDYDFLMRVAVKDIQAYHTFLMTKLFQIKTISKVDSAVVMRESKKVTAYPLEAKFNKTY
jgi:Lrp/AsnC family transcriptional regulator, leucine-responsive regulatory protein